MTRRWFGGLQRFLVMLVAATAISSGFLLAMMSIGMVGLVAFFNRGNGMSSAEASEIALRVFTLDGPRIAVSLAILYCVALLVAVGLCRLNRKLHGISFLAAGVAPTLWPVLMMALRGEPINVNLPSVLVGAGIGWLTGWIWRRRPSPPSASHVP